MKFQRAQISQLLHEGLYVNSYFIILANLVNYGSGFLFWIIAARFYSVNDIGVSSAILSVSWLIGLFSLLGFDIGLIRFLPTANNKKALINTCITVSIIATLSLSLMAVILPFFKNSDISIISSNLLYVSIFIFITIAFVIINLQNSIFIGIKQTKYSVLQNILSFIKILFLPIMIVFGCFGIFVSTGISYIVMTAFGMYLLLKIEPGFRYNYVIDRGILNDITNYSIKNYLVNIFLSLPGYILSIIVISLLGAVDNAFFYIAWSIVNIVLVIPNSISRSLLAEGSNSINNLKSNIIKSIVLSYLFLIPLVIIIVLFGKFILLCYNQDYANNSYNVLILLTLASIPYTINSIYATVKQIERDMTPIILMYGGILVITIFGSIMSLKSLGLNGLALSWIVGNLIFSIFSLNHIITKINR